MLDMNCAKEIIWLTQYSDSCAAGARVIGRYLHHWRGGGTTKYVGIIESTVIVHVHDLCESNAVPQIISELRQHSP